MTRETFEAGIAYEGERLILQMGYRKHFGKLIEQNEEHCSHKAGQIAFQNR